MYTSPCIVYIHNIFLVHGWISSPLKELAPTYEIIERRVGNDMLKWQVVNLLKLVIKHNRSTHGVSYTPSFTPATGVTILSLGIMDVFAPTQLKHCDKFS